VKSDKPYPHSYLEIEPADEAYENVLAGAGATRPKRDAVDQRIIEMVRTGKVTTERDPGVADQLKNVGYSDDVIGRIAALVPRGIITDIAQVGGYPEYRGEPYDDMDSDGMPNDWETQHGLNPDDASDAAGDLNRDGYTNIEDFLNGLDPTGSKREWPAPKTYVDLFEHVER
jgi:hypothetical protein